MAGLRDEVVSWLYEDFWEVHRDDQRQSALVGNIFDTHAQAFRVRAKRLSRESLEAVRPGAKLDLVRLLAQELIGGQRLTGKTGGGVVRMAPIIERKSLSVLMEACGHAQRGGACWTPCPADASLKERRQRAHEVRTALTELLETLDVDPASADGIPLDRLLALVGDMLSADCPKGVVDMWAGKSNVVETCLELLEDVRRDPRVSLGGMDAGRAAAFVAGDRFEKLVKNQVTGGCTLEGIRAAFQLGADVRAAEGIVREMAVKEAKQTLANLGRPAPQPDGTFPDPEPPSKQGIDLAYVELYLRACGGYAVDGEDDDLCDDLAILYDETRSQQRYEQLFVPAAIDAASGVGLYLVGRDKCAIFTPSETLGKRMPSTTVMAIDHRLSQPCELLGEDVLSADAAQIQQLLRQMKGRWGTELHPVRHNVKAEYLDRFLGSRRSASEVSKAVGEVHMEYREMCRISLRDSWPKAQGVEEPPEDCPERFLHYFGGKVDLQP